MRKLVVIFDIAAFIILGTVSVLCALAALIVPSCFGKRRYTGGGVNEFSFPVFDLISNKYPGMFEDALSGGYISKSYYVYLDFDNRQDRFQNIEDKIYFYSIAAHPNKTLYNAGFYRVNALLTELKVLKEGFSIISKSNITFIKAHDQHLLGLNGLFLARLFRLPCILHMNTDFEMKYRGTKRISSSIFITRGLERIFESIIISSYDLIMADREFYKHSRSFPRRSIKKYISCGVRVDKPYYSGLAARRDMKKELGLTGNKVLLYVGRLHPVKYPEDAIEAFARVKDSLKNTVLLMVGAGILKEALESLVRKRHLEDSVFFLGSKSHEELADLFYSADVLIAPHGGVTLVESALASTPIVAYDFDWHPEFLENGKMGFMVPFRDIEKLAARALDLLSDEEINRKMGEYSRNVAISKYSREKSIDNEKKIYDKLIGR